MIVTHYPNGEISTIYLDPVPKDQAGLLEAAGTLFVNLPPTPVYDGTFDDNGNPNIKEYISAEVDHDAHYVQGGTLASRPALDLPDEIEVEVGAEIELMGLPAPCMVVIDSDVHQIEDPDLTLDADMPAEYSILIEKFPYQRKIIKVTVNGTA